MVHRLSGCTAPRCPRRSFRVAVGQRLHLDDDFIDFGRRATHGQLHGLAKFDDEGLQLLVHVISIFDGQSVWSKQDLT